MKVLFVHECLGARGGAETNIQITACELARRGHVVALLHGPATGKNEEQWRSTFSEFFTLAEDKGSVVRRGERALPGLNSEISWRAWSVVEEFKPDLIYLHSVADLELLEIL